MNKEQEIIKSVIKQFKIARFEAGNFHNLIKKDYGPYKNDDLEIDRVLYKKGSGEVVVKFIKINEKSNFTKFNREMKNIAKKFGLRYKKTDVVRENVIVSFERISLL